MPSETERVEHQWCAGRELRSEQRRKGPCGAAGRPGAREILQVDPRLVADHRREARQPAVETLDALGRRPLLGPEDVGRPRGPWKGCPHRRRPGWRCRRGAVAPGQIEARDPPQVAPAPGQHVAVGIEGADAERGGEPEAPVVRGAPSQPDDDPAAAQVERGEDQLAGAAGRGDLRIALAVAEQLIAGCLGQLDNGDAAGQLSEAGLHRAPERIRHAHAAAAAVGGGHEGPMVPSPRRRPAAHRRRTGHRQPYPGGDRRAAADADNAP